MLMEELLLGAACCACVGLFADTLPQAEGGKLTLDVPSGKVTYENAVPTGVTVEKTGAGEAVLAVASAGDGHDGEGCLRYVPVKNGSNTMSDGLFSGDVVLSGDATVKQIAANGRWGFWGNGWDQSSFDLNGHVFTAVDTGNSVLGFGNLRFKNSGAKEDGRLVVRGPTTIITVSGAEGRLCAPYGMNTWRTNASALAVLNLRKGGRLETGYFRHASSAFCTSKNPADMTAGQKLFWNFDGGGRRDGAARERLRAPVHHRPPRHVARLHEEPRHDDHLPLGR